jgi:hypothetical protein
LQVLFLPISVRKGGLFLLISYSRVSDKMH